MPLEEHCHVLGRCPVPGSRAGTHIPRLARKKNIKKAARHTLLYKHIVHAHAVPPPARPRTHARGVVYPVQSDAKQKRKEKPGETSLALRCVGHTHNVQIML